MPYEIRESRLFSDYHSPFREVPVLSSTHTYLCMHLQASLACAYTHMYTCTKQISYTPTVKKPKDWRFYKMQHLSLISDNIFQFKENNSQFVTVRH